MKIEIITAGNEWYIVTDSIEISTDLMRNIGKALIEKAKEIDIKDCKAIKVCPFCDNNDLKLDKDY